MFVMLILVKLLTINI